MSRFSEVILALSLAHIYAVYAIERKPVNVTLNAHGGAARPLLEIDLRDVLLKDAKPQKVAVFVQAANMSLFDDMTQCIVNVGEAQRAIGGDVDVYVSTIKQEDADQARYRLKGLVGLGLVKVEQVLNKGGDVGQFLQQLTQASAAHYDAVLKVHTKSRDPVRKYALNMLCGSVDTARKVIYSFSQNPKLGIAGPKGFTLATGMPESEFKTADHLWWAGDRRGHIKYALWQDKNVVAMRKTWSLIFPSQPMPEKDEWVIIAATFFWARGSQIAGNQQFIAAIPSLLDSMRFGYARGSCCKTPHALERLFATMVRHSGSTVARITN